MNFDSNTVTWLEIGIGDWSIPSVDLECLLERTVATVTEVVTPTAQNDRIRLGLPV